MNRIILIGNGFDLAHGLKSKYEHFIEAYWNQKAKAFQNAYIEKKVVSIGRDVYKFEDDDIIVNGIIFYSNVNLSTCSNTKGYEGFFNLLSCIGIRNEQNLVFKNKFLEQITKKNTLKYWVDIETEYYFALNQCLVDKNNDKIEKLNNDFLSIRNELIKYLHAQVSELPDKSPSIESKIYTEPFDIRGLGNNDFVIYLNFNYTHLEVLYCNDKNMDKIIHIHGMLGEPRNPIIFGYGDELDSKFGLIEQENDNRYLENIKSIKYVETRNYQDLLNYIQGIIEFII